MNHQSSMMINVILWRFAEKCDQYAMHRRILRRWNDIPVEKITKLSNRGGRGVSIAPHADFAHSSYNWITKIVDLGSHVFGSRDKFSRAFWEVRQDNVDLSTAWKGMDSTLQQISSDPVKYWGNNHNTTKDRPIGQEWRTPQSGEGLFNQFEYGLWIRPN